MRQVVVLSGKGGTGKTTVTGALAARGLVRPAVVLVDADVDAANLALLLDPVPEEEHAFAGLPRAAVDASSCAGCGACAHACRFGALSMDRRGVARVDPLACEGCFACAPVCPQGAIHSVPRPGGTWWRSRTRHGELFHAELEPGEESSGRLVTALREAARRRAEAVGAGLVLIDGPPGIACPAIAAVGGTDLGIVVTEPTVAAEQDLCRALDLLAHFGIPPLVVVNKATAAPRAARQIGALVRSRGLEPPTFMPSDRAVVAAVRAGRCVGPGDLGRAASALGRLADRVRARLALCRAAPPPMATVPPGS